MLVPKTVRWLVKQQVLETMGFFVVFALALFLPAGTLAWTAGWIFLLLFFGFYIAVTSWLYRHNPGLMQERMRLVTSDQQGWDKILFPIMEIFFIVWLIFISLDAVRFHWSPVPFWIQVIGMLILLCSFYFLFLTFSENSYLSPVVRLQEERGTYGDIYRISITMYGIQCIWQSSCLLWELFIAWLLVWVDFCDHMYVHTRKARSPGRTDAAERTSWLCGLQGTREISFHSIYLGKSPKVLCQYH